jgi:pimeloyl-ACP methyl ester carboxylesterase
MGDQNLIPYDDAARKALDAGTNLPPLKGTYFYGGAGFNGGYLPDMLAALREAGISNVRAGNSKESIGQSQFGSSGSGYPAMVTDAAAVTSLNQSGYYLIIMNGEYSTEGPQFNLIGYSYGTIIAAVKALSYANVYQGTIDHVVLVGAPIEASLLNELRSNRRIKKVIVVDLTAQGDPIYAGMTDWEIVTNAPELFGQMMSNSGHFWYAPATADGAKRRRELAKYLFDQGLR